jgi:hypothetical protein
MPVRAGAPWVAVQARAFWPLPTDARRRRAGMRTTYKVDKVPFFKHSEDFLLGRETVMGRRDKKGGEQRAFLREVPEGLQIDIQLEQPLPGGPAPRREQAGAETLCRPGLLPFRLSSHCLHTRLLWLLSRSRHQACCAPVSTGEPGAPATAL